MTTIKLNLRSLFFLLCLNLVSIAIIAQNGNGNGNGGNNNGNGTNWLPNNGNVGVGTLQPNYKLEVIGNSKFTENVKMDKDLNVNTISVYRIKPLLGDSLIHFGDSSIVLQNPVYSPNGNSTGYHKIYTNQHILREIVGGLNEPGLAIGRTSVAESEASFAMGHQLKVKFGADRALVLGSGYYSTRGFTVAMPLINTFSNSVMLGANSPFSSIFIKQGNNERAGFVGINNVNPTKEFDVEGAVRVRNLQNSTGEEKVYADADGTLKLSTRPEPKPWLLDGNSSVDPDKNWLGTNDNFGLSIRTKSLERIFINNNGQVIITNQGYADPRFAPSAYIFAVNGKAIMEECEIRLKANGTWPDYVFADDYKLKTIEEQKEFIQKNKHLPGFKTAKEIETKESFGLGETQRLQQEKIEELFLYVIQLKEQNDALKKQVEQLQNK